MTILVLHQVVPHTFYNKIAPMDTRVYFLSGIQPKKSTEIQMNVYQPYRSDDFRQAS